MIEEDFPLKPPQAPHIVLLLRIREKKCILSLAFQMEYLLEDRFLDFSCVGEKLTFLSLACLTCSSIFWARGGGQLNTRPHKVCARDFSLSLRLPERHIKVNCGTQEPLDSRACDNRGIKSGSLDTNTAHAHKGNRKLNIPFPANLLLVFQVSLLFVAVFWVRIES